MTHFERTMADAKTEELLEAIRRAIEADGFAEVPACMRRSFCKGHKGVPEDCEGLWSVTVKKGDNIVFLKKETSPSGVGSPQKKGCESPSSRCA